MGCADIDPVAVEEEILAVVFDDVRRLQPSWGLSKIWIRYHENTHGRPVLVEERRALPAMEEPPLAAASGPSTAGGHLPCLIGGLPDGKVQGLLTIPVVVAEIGVPSDGPPVSVNLWNENFFVGIFQIFVSINLIGSCEFSDIFEGNRPPLIAGGVQFKPLSVMRPWPCFNGV